MQLRESQICDITVVKLNREKIYFNGICLASLCLSMKLENGFSYEKRLKGKKFREFLSINNWIFIIMTLTKVSYPSKHSLYQNL